MTNPQDPYGGQNPYQGGYQQYPQQPYGQQPYGQQAYAQPRYGGYPPQYPGGQPPIKPKRTGLFIAIGVAVVLVITVVVAAVLLVLRSRDDGSSASPPTVASTDISGDKCGLPGTGSTAEITDRVVSGPLSFPVSAAPGWTKEGYAVYAQSIAPAGLEKSMGDGQSWQAGAEVGQTNFGTTLDPKDAVARMIPCIAAGAGYNRTQARIEDLSQPEATTVDGVPAAKVTAKILVTADNVTVPGDVVTVIVIASAPQTYALTVIPIGRDDMAAVGKAIIEQLKVAKDV